MYYTDPTSISGPLGTRSLDLIEHNTEEVDTTSESLATIASEQLNHSYKNVNPNSHSQPDDSPHREEITGTPIPFERPFT